MPLYEITWHKEGFDFFDDWFAVELTIEGALSEYEGLNPDIIAEIEGVPITVSLLAFDALDRNGTPISPSVEDFEEQWYSNGPRTLLKIKRNRH